MKNKIDVKEKTCPKCKKSFPFTVVNFFRNKNTKDGLSCYCKKCNNINNKKYRPLYNHKQQEYQKKFHSIHKERINKQLRDNWKNDRLKCLQHYSMVIPFCACCKETTIEFLSIDHINGGGRKHLEEIGGKLVRWLIKNNYPEGFRVLCFNCNLSRGHYNYCPHENK